MSKYRSSSVKTPKERSKQPHYLWRGIGCLMMIIIPAMSIALAYETVNYGLNNGWPIPYQLLGTPRFPDVFYKSSGMMLLLSPIIAIRHFYAYAAVSFIYMILLSGVLSMLYAIVYGMIGPSRYSPLDAPPPKIKAKPYKR
ncbi:MAG: hypothetical protein HXY38_07850 [Chloroflexi bacterium]|nr:hypothetical protein [Chloroflexota bacterium]